MSHARSPKVHHHHHHHHQQQQQQQQTASPNHSVAHTGVKRGRRALLEQVDPTLSLPLDRSRWLIVGVRPLRNPPFARRLGGPKGWVGKGKKRKGKERRRPPLWSQMPRREEKGEEEKKKKKVCVWADEWGSSEHGLMVAHLLYQALYRSAKEGEEKKRGDSPSLPSTRLFFSLSVIGGDPRMGKWQSSLWSSSSHFCSLKVLGESGFAPTVICVINSWERGVFIHLEPPKVHMRLLWCVCAGGNNKCALLVWMCLADNAWGFPHTHTHTHTQTHTQAQEWQPHTHTNVTLHVFVFNAAAKFVFLSCHIDNIVNLTIRLLFPPQFSTGI